MVPWVGKKFVSALVTINATAVRTVTSTLIAGPRKIALAKMFVLIARPFVIAPTHLAVVTFVITFTHLKKAATAMSLVTTSYKTDTGPVFNVPWTLNLWACLPIATSTTPSIFMTLSSKANTFTI